MAAVAYTLAIRPVTHQVIHRVIHKVIHKARDSTKAVVVWYQGAAQQEGRGGTRGWLVTLCWVPAHTQPHHCQVPHR